MFTGVVMGRVTKTTFVCPNCGGDVPTKAKACPHCGSDENTGWSEDTYLDGIGLYDDSDYEAFIHREFGRPARPMNWKQVLIIGAAVGLVIVFLLRYLIRF